MAHNSFEWSSFLEASRSLLAVVPMQPADSAMHMGIDEADTDEAPCRIVPQDRVLQFNDGALHVREHFQLEVPSVEAEGNTGGHAGGLGSSSASGRRSPVQAFAMVLHPCWFFKSSEEAKAYMANNRIKLLEASSSVGCGMMKETTFESIYEHMTAHVTASASPQVTKQQVMAQVAEITLQVDEFAWSRLRSFTPGHQFGHLQGKMNGFCLIARIHNVLFKYFVSSHVPSLNDLTMIIVIDAVRRHTHRIRTLRQPTGAWPPLITTQMEGTRQNGQLLNLLQSAGISWARGDSTAVGTIVEVNKRLEQEFGAYRCGGCGAVPSGRKQHKVCSVCKTVYYCSQECQRADWRAGHKGSCRPPDPDGV